MPRVPLPPPPHPLPGAHHTHHAPVPASGWLMCVPVQPPVGLQWISVFAVLPPVVWREVVLHSENFFGFLIGIPGAGAGRVACCTVAGNNQWAWADHIHLPTPTCLYTCRAHTHTADIPFMPPPFPHTPPPPSATSHTGPPHHFGTQIAAGCDPCSSIVLPST